MRRWTWGWVGGLALLLLGPAAAAPVSAGDAAERERIVRERAAVEARFQAARSDCETRFASTACLNAARAERRGAMEGLKREEVVLDTAQRRQRAADRMRRINDKVREADARPPASALPASPGRGPIEKKVRKPARAPRAAKAVPDAVAAAPARPAAAAGRKVERQAVRKAPHAHKADNAAQHAARRAAYEHRQAEAQARRDAAAKRNAERAAKGKPAAPLPPRPGLPAR